VMIFIVVRNTYNDVVTQCNLAILDAEKRGFIQALQPTEYTAVINLTGILTKTNGTV